MSEGLRSQKKQETRKTISDVATRLFVERGFEEVTIAEVAAAARVAKMTVTNHFPRKEDLVFDIRAEFTAWPATLIKDRPFDEVRDAYFAAVAQQHAYVGFSGPPFVRMIQESAALSAALHDMHRAREEAMREVLVARNPDGGILPRAAAAHLTAVLRLLFDEAFELSRADVPRDDLAAALITSATAAFDQLEPALRQCP